MASIIYNPDEVGKESLNSKGKLIKNRKYHLTDDEMPIVRKKWLAEIKGTDLKLKSKAGRVFFNPYRQGIYYYQIQTLFLLGANEWHSLPEIIEKLEEYTSGISLRASVVKSKGYQSAWDKFRGKINRPWAKISKDYVGRIQDNYVMLQRLSQKHPYGYKLNQVCGAIDIKRIDKEGFTQGFYYYRLSTYRKRSEALPIKDFSEFTFPRHKGKYISRKFLGTIVTSDGIIKAGRLV